MSFLNRTGRGHLELIIIYCGHCGGEGDHKKTLPPSLGARPHEPALQGLPLENSHRIHARTTS